MSTPDLRLPVNPLKYLDGTGSRFVSSGFRRFALCA
jgi:hypothetical protein